jgi:hypothetical protein
MRDPQTGLYSEVFNGEQGYQDINTFIITKGIKSGEKYTFKVKGAYINGYTDESDENTIIACLPPSGMEAPAFVSSSSSGVTLSWKQPSSNGGCSITGFRLYVNDGLGGTTFTEIDSGTVRSKPEYTQHYTTSLPTPTVGRTYAFKVEAFNEVGSVMSSSAGFVLADVPDDPTIAPYSDTTVTSTSRVKININPVAGDGGSPITSYSLEVDDGRGGPFVPMYGILTDSLSLTYTFTHGVQRGLVFRARYRLRNIVGWS